MWVGLSVSGVVTPAIATTAWEKITALWAAL